MQMMHVAHTSKTTSLLIFADAAAATKTSKKRGKMRALLSSALW
jgi:hypothetical protein